MKQKQMLDATVKMAMGSYTFMPIASVPLMAALRPRVDLDFSSGAPLIGFNLDMAKHRK